MICGSALTAVDVSYFLFSVIGPRGLTGSTATHDKASAAEI